MIAAASNDNDNDDAWLIDLTMAVSKQAVRDFAAGLAEKAQSDPMWATWILDEAEIYVSAAPG